MSDIAAPLGFSSGYVSDAELMGWLNERSIDQNSMLRDMMETSTVRTHLIQALTNIKGQVSADGHPGDIATMIDELVNDPELADYKAELQTLLGPTQDHLREVASAAQDAADYAAENGEPPPAQKVMTDEDLKQDKAKLLEVLGGEVTRLSTDDQLALVQIQALSSQTRELSQLASNLLESRSQARNNIVGNIRG